MRKVVELRKDYLSSKNSSSVEFGRESRADIFSMAAFQPFLWLVLNFKFFSSLFEE